MTFGEKLRGFIDQGLSVSKDFATKASAKAQDLGAKGVLRLEIAQLESQAGKLTAKLGAEVYQAFIEKDQKTISKDSPLIRDILAEIAGLKAAIEKREAELHDSSDNSIGKA